jgi:hypothetical protein
VLGFNENQQSIVAASGIILLIAALPWIRSWILRAVVGTVCVAGTYVALLGSSRTAAVSVSAAMLYIGVAAWRSGAWRRRGNGLDALLVAGIAAAFIFAAVLQSSEVMQESVSANAQRGEQAMEGADRGLRDVAAWGTVNIILENPIGIGFGRTLDYLDMDPHNSYLKIIAEGGAIAGILLLLAMWHQGMALRVLARHTPMFGIGAVFTLLSVSALAGQTLLEPTYWFFLALIVAYANKPTQDWIEWLPFARMKPTAERIEGTATQVSAT